MFTACARALLRIVVLVHFSRPLTLPCWDIYVVIKVVIVALTLPHKQHHSLGFSPGSWLSRTQRWWLTQLGLTAALYQQSSKSAGGRAHLVNPLRNMYQMVGQRPMHHLYSFMMSCLYIYTTQHRCFAHKGLLQSVLSYSINFGPFLTQFKRWRIN